MAEPILLAKAAATILSDERTRKIAGWAIAAILSPLIVTLALFCSLASGAGEFNDAAVELVFLGGTIPASYPEEYAQHIQAMRDCLDVLDAAIAEANNQLDSGTLDSALVEAAFYTLHFGKENLELSPEDARAFVDCFARYEAPARPVSTSEAYANLSVLGYPPSETWAECAQELYRRIAYGNGGDSFSGSITHGGSASVSLDIDLVDPSTKNAADLVRYAENAWRSGWGYVWGSFGNVLTESEFAYKLRQYPDGVGRYQDFIAANWLGRRTADCAGLIKGYGWLDPSSMTIRYGSNGMPDLGSDAMYRSAVVKGPISTIPEVPGLAVWRSGHIGVYIGNGEVIEAMGTKYGVVRTKLAERNFTHWLEVAYIYYE